MIPTDRGYMVIKEAPESALNSYICIFDLDASAGDPNPDATGVAGARDISPVRIDSYIKVDPQTLAHHAFTEVPKQMLSTISGMDVIMTSIRARLARWWPEIASMA